MLAGALLNETDLRGASLHDAELATATLSGVLLADADLTRAHLSRTVFARCRDLDRAIGLETLQYMSHSSIDLETLRICLAGLSDDFLEGVGVEPREIEVLRELGAQLA
jgi:uncharacterized protein YjbI with pentapeptide repeats